MKIKLAVLEKDVAYLNRLVTAFSTKYADKFEIYSFTDKDVAIKALEDVKAEVLICDDSFDINIKDLPARCGFAYLVNSADIETVRDQRAICKFQKADLIYKQILSIYSENASAITGLKMTEDHCRLVAFGSPSGGVGSSTMAAACAVHFAAQHKKVLYLNLEPFGSADAFFSAEGLFDMSDIVFALKSKKANLSLKLESCVKQDNRGVFFYSAPKIALDIMELNTDDKIRLISEAKLMGSYDYIIVDHHFALDKDTLKILRQMHEVIIVGDGSEISNNKIIRAINALNILEQNEDSSLISRTSIVYNKFSNKTGKAIDSLNINNLGGAPRYEHATVEQIIAQLSANAMFDKI